MIRSLQDIGKRASALLSDSGARNERKTLATPDHLEATFAAMHFASHSLPVPRDRDQNGTQTHAHTQRSSE